MSTNPNTNPAGNPNINPNKALWEKGDFTRIADTMRAAGAAWVADTGVTPGMRVLDLGCGDGTTAIPAARAGATVRGVDIAPYLVEAGRRRAEAFRLSNISFEEGDASRLDALADDSFDLTMSVFGAMVAPKPFEVAKEMVRVTRPGGRVVMGNWIPGDPTLVAQILKIAAHYTPPPPEGFVSPMTWGVESHVVERFAAAGIPKENIAFSRDIFRFDYDGTPAQYLGLFRDYYSPTMNAFAAARAAGREAGLQRELEELFIRCNESPSATQIPATVLRVTVQKPMN
jgi:SAM-dependent methyltransferase